MADNANQEEGTSTEPPLKRQKGLSEKCTQAHVAALLGMKSVEPRAIAYTAVQVGNTCNDVVKVLVDWIASCILLYRAAMPGASLMKTSTMQRFTRISYSSLRMLVQCGKRTKLLTSSTGGIGWLFNLVYKQLIHVLLALFLAIATLLSTIPSQLRKCRWPQP